MNLVWIHAAATVLESTLAHSLNSAGTPTLVVEMGIGIRITRAFGEQLLTGILSLMAHLGMWDAPVAPIAPPIISSDGSVSFVNANFPGVFFPSVEHGVRVEKGQELGIIADPLTGGIRETLYSPASGSALHPAGISGGLCGFADRPCVGRQCMREEVLFTLDTPYRQPLAVKGWFFGAPGKKTLAVMGALRGNEIQQMYLCSQLIQHLAALEQSGGAVRRMRHSGHPLRQPVLHERGRRFWAADNTESTGCSPATTPRDHPAHRGADL